LKEGEGLENQPVAFFAFYQEWMGVNDVGIFYFGEPEQLFEYGTKRQLEQMATRLIELGYEDAAKETLNLKYIIDQSLVRAETHAERMKDIWQAIEKNDSADWGKDRIAHAIEEYRTK
jgi:hypothetical protein